MKELLQSDSINQIEITDTKRVKKIWLGLVDVLRNFTYDFGC
jgi:hypothetical protein